MEGRMENAAARSKLPLPLPVVGANLEDQHGTVGTAQDALAGHKAVTRNRYPRYASNRVATNAPTKGFILFLINFMTNHPICGSCPHSYHGSKIHHRMMKSQWQHFHGVVACSRTLGYLKGQHVFQSHGLLSSRSQFCIPLPPRLTMTLMPPRFVSTEWSHSGFGL